MSLPVARLTLDGAVVSVVTAAAPPAPRVRPAEIAGGARDDQRHVETTRCGAVARQGLAGSRSSRADQQLLPALRHTQLGLYAVSKLPERRRAGQKEVASLPGQ